MTESRTCWRCNGAKTLDEADYSGPCPTCEGKGTVSEARRKVIEEERIAKEHAEGGTGTCAFCGTGHGYLGEQGDESTQYLHGAVRTGEAPDWKYERHPKGHGPGKQTVTWCGRCVAGLAHKYQRYDDANLHALHVAGKVRLELDGLRWTHWNRDDAPALTKAGHPRDDTAVHMEKLRLRDDLTDMQNELFRRAGFDLTTRGWRQGDPLGNYDVNEA